MAKEKVITYTPNDQAIVDALKNAPEGLTLAQLREITGISLAPGHVVSAMKKGLIAATGEVEVMKVGKGQVSTYNFATADVLEKDGKPCNYTDGEKEVLKAAASIDSPFTLAELATAMGLEKLSSGRINGLVSKGNITKGEPKEVERLSKSTVKVYSFVKDIPTAE